MLCRLPHPMIADFIPQGFARVLKHRQRWNPTTKQLSGLKIVPYIYLIPNSQPIKQGYATFWSILDLDLQYSTLYRWSDLQRRFGEPVTGPNMTKLLINGKQLD